MIAIGAAMIGFSHTVIPAKAGIQCLSAPTYIKT